MGLRKSARQICRQEKKQKTFVERLIKFAILRSIRRDLTSSSYTIVCVNFANQIHIYILWFLFTVKYKLPPALFSSHVRLNNLWSALEGISGEGLEIPEACGLHPSPEVSKIIPSSTFSLYLAPNKAKSFPSYLSMWLVRFLSLYLLNLKRPGSMKLYLLLPASQTIR